MWGLINKNYLLGAFNLILLTVAAIALGVLLILQVKAYELQVSPSFSWQFFFHDPFATRLSLILVLTILINVSSAFVQMSNLYNRIVQTNLIVFSLTSIVWILLYIATDYTFQSPIMLPMVFLLLSLVILLGHQLTRLRMKIFLGLTTALVILAAIWGQMTDSYFHQIYVQPLITVPID